jgi:hypothetical protein
MGPKNTEAGVNPPSLFWIQFDLMPTIVRSSPRAAEGRAMARPRWRPICRAVGDLFAKRDRERLPAQCGPTFEIQPATA